MSLAAAGPGGILCVYVWRCPADCHHHGAHTGDASLWTSWHSVHRFRLSRATTQESTELLRAGLLPDSNCATRAIGYRQTMHAILELSGRTEVATHDDLVCVQALRWPVGMVRCPSAANVTCSAHGACGLRHRFSMMHRAITADLCICAGRVASPSASSYSAALPSSGDLVSESS